MKLCLYICTRTYFLSENVSVSLILDAKHKVYYFLKGISSTLWDLIVKYQDFEEVMSYAKNNNIENELSALLYELKERKIITTDKTFEKSNYNFLANKIFDKPSKQMQYFDVKMSEFALCHGFINALILELNYNCNLKCKHCYNHKNIDKYLSFEEAKKAIDEAYNMGIFTVRLTGGECTINKDFLKICEYIRSKYLKLCVFTNGQTFSDNDELFKKFINLYPSFIQYSIYSMDENVHDSITGVKGSWQKTMNAINKTKEYPNIHMKIATQLISYNKESYKEVQEFANSIGAIYGDNCIFTSNPENNNLHLKMTYDEIKKFYMEKTPILPFMKPRFKKDDNLICEAGSDRLCITPRLDVMPCVAFDYVLGNLNKTSLVEIKETTLKDFKKKFIRKNLTECFDEEYCKYCFYCPDTSSYNNTFMKKQPISCENAKAYYNALKSVYFDKKGKNSEKVSKI